MEVKKSIDGKGKKRFIVVSSKGATVTKFSWDGYDIIYPQLLKKVKLGKNETKNKLRGGIPICFPFFGPPPEKHAGLDKHGWLRNQELNLENEDDQSLRFWGLNTKNCYYEFCIFQQIRVSLTKEKGLCINFIASRSKSDLPYKKASINPAFHPYFSNLGNRSVRIGKKIITEFTEEAVILPAKKEMIIDLGAKKVKMTIDGNFRKDPYVALWSDSKDYFCVEPILGNPKNVGTSKGRTMKEFFRMTFNLKVIK